MSEIPEYVRPASSVINEQVCLDPSLDTQTVMLVVTEACNLQCVYCYEKTKTTRTMPESLIRDIIVRHMSQERFSNISFDFFGGEPLLQFDTIQSVVNWFHTRTWKKGHRFTLSTNGTLLDDDNKRWLESVRDCVIPMVSLDGTKTAHDANRSNSYDRVVCHAPFLRDHWPEQPVRITVGPNTLDQLAAGIKHIHSMGLAVEAGVVFEDIWGSPDEKATHLETYERQLAELVVFYGENPNLPVPMILSRKIDSLLMKHEPGRPYCGAGEFMVCYTPDGATYPCHRFTPFCSTRPSPRPLADIAALDGEPCQNCLLIPICPTCQGFNWEVHSNTLRRTTFHCEFFKRDIVASAKLLIRRIEDRLDGPDLSDREAEEMAQQVVCIQKLLDSSPHLRAPTG